jgi:hypothetical protein
VRKRIGVFDPHRLEASVMWRGSVVRVPERSLMFLEQSDRAGWNDQTGTSPCDLRALPRLRVNLECPADRIQSVGHALQTGPVAGLGRFKPVAVVGDLEGEFPVGLGEANLRSVAPAYFATLFSASRAQK